MFIKLENMSGPFQRAFKIAYPYSYGLRYHEEGARSPSQVGEEAIIVGKQVFTSLAGDRGKQFDILEKEFKLTSKYIGKYKLNGGVKKSSSKSPRNFILDSKQQWTSIKSRSVSSKGLGKSMILVDVLNFGLEKYINESISDDLFDIHHQTSGKRVIDKDSKRWVNERSALSQSIDDVFDAVEGGMLDYYKEDISSISDIIKVVLYGGDGTESPEIIDLGHRIINKYSSEEAKTRLDIKETLDRINVIIENLNESNNND